MKKYIFMCFDYQWQLGYHGNKCQCWGGPFFRLCPIILCQFPCKRVLSQLILMPSVQCITTFILLILKTFATFWPGQKWVFCGPNLGNQLSTFLPNNYLDINPDNHKFAYTHLCTGHFTNLLIPMNLFHYFCWFTFLIQGCA